MTKKRVLQNLNSSGLRENTKDYAGGVEVKVKCVGRGYAQRKNPSVIEDNFFQYVPREARFFRVVAMADKNRIYILDYFAPERGKSK